MIPLVSRVTETLILGAPVVLYLTSMKSLGSRLEDQSSMVEVVLALGIRTLNPIGAEKGKLSYHLG